MYDSPFNGRMNRQNFIYGQLLLIIAMTLYALFVFRDGLTIYNVTDMLPVLILAMIPQIVLAVRRLHDINLPGIWSILIIMPYISLIFAVYISVKAGTLGVNKYGEPDDRSLVDSLLNKIT